MCHSLCLIQCLLSLRWCRSPELLFGARMYGEGVDMWAVGRGLRPCGASAGGHSWPGMSSCLNSFLVPWNISSVLQETTSSNDYRVYSPSTPPHALQLHSL
nr:cyclin-dependent kinase-like 1 isoform X3 [Salvelinus alpinus]